MIAAILLASASAAPAPIPMARATAVARARIITAPRLDLRSPPKGVVGTQRGKRTIDFE